MGIPIGTKKFITDFIIQSLKEKVNACKRLVELPTQIAYHMLRLVIAPTPGFLVRALGDNLALFKEWDRGVEREVFRLANQMHDYLEYKGREEDRIIEEDLEKLLKNYEREVKVKKRTSHSKENFQLAETLIFLSSREGGLGIMQVERMAMNAFLASSLNSMAILGCRKIEFALSEKTRSLIKSNIEKLKRINTKSLAEKIEKDEYEKISTSETQKLQRELTLVTQEDLKTQIKESFKEESMKRLEPLFEDHQGDHANRVLIKPPTFTKTYQIEDGEMQEIISQTLLLPNDLGIRKCVAGKSRSDDNHQCVNANHMNACSYTGGVGMRHTQAKHTLEKALKVAGINHSNERQMAKEGTNFRADIYISNAEEPTVIDVTCVQTSQNHKTLDKAMENAYDGKIKYYNDMKNKCQLREEFKKGVKLIPVVIGPRGQFYSKSWRDVTRIFGIQSSKASRQEALGVAPILKNDLDPEKASLVISLLKGLAFRAAVSTAQNARKWQELQREHWNLNELASRVTIERPKRG